MPFHFLVDVSDGLEGWGPVPLMDFPSVYSNFANEHLVVEAQVAVEVEASQVPTLLDLVNDYWNVKNPQQCQYIL